MGTTPKPLVIWADLTLYDDPELLRLKNQGHTVVFISESPDLILGPNCWRIVKGLESYIPIAVASTRKRRYPSKKGTVSLE